MEKNCKIYKIIDNTNGNCYIGSTTQSLNKRLSEHKTKCNYVKKCTSYQIINNGYYHIELIEDIGIVDRQERDAKERYYIENTECVNKYIPGRSQKEYDRNRPNKKERLEKNKEHYNANKQTILEKQKEKFTCECGIQYARTHKARHCRSQKHQKYLESITI